MSKEKTAMQMLIEEIGLMRDAHHIGIQEHRFARGRIVDFIIQAKSLLEKEQEQIEKAFDDGYSDGLGAGTGSGFIEYSNVRYYNSKYRGE